MKKNYSFGCIITDKYKAKNYKLKDIIDKSKSVDSAVLQSFPLEFRLPDAPMKNQGSVNACSAYAVCVNRNIKEREQYGNSTLEFSEGFLYGNRKESQWQGEGMITEENLTNLVNDGVCHIDLLPQIEEMPIMKNIVDSNFNYYKNNGFRHRITSFYEIENGDIEGIKWALMNLGAVVSTFYWQNDFNSEMLNNTIPFPVGTDGMGHATVIVGWDKYGRWIVQNSWGDQWGDEGYFYVAQNYPFKQLFALADGVFEQSVEDLYFVVSFENAMSDDESTIESMVSTYNIMLSQGGKYEYDYVEYDGKFYLIVKDKFFSNRNDAKEYEKEFKEDFGGNVTIIPIVKNLKKYYLCFNYPTTQDGANNLINNFNPTIPIHHEYEMTAYLYSDGHYYVVVKSADTLSEIDQFRQRQLDEEDPIYSSCIVLEGE